jgi:hypothetical protein
MNDDAPAQEIHGTVVGSGRFPEPAADDRAEVADQDDERPDATDPGYRRAAADRGAGDEVVDADAVIIEEVDEVPTGDEPPAEDAETAAAVDHDAAEAATVPETDVIAEAARPGVPRHAGMPSAADSPAAADVAGDPGQLREQWLAIQSTFVDDPRASVASAAELVSEAIEALVASVQERERGLRGQWEREDADTEDLRNALRGYRGLLDQVAAR